MEQEIRLLCSGYGAETGSDLLAVKLFENTETGEVHTERTGGIRQGDSPSFSLLHGGFLYTVAELVGEKPAYIYQYRLSEDGIPVPTGKKIFLPGGELCHLYAGKKALKSKQNRRIGHRISRTCGKMTISSCSKMKK